MLKTNENLVVEMFMECKPGPPRVGPGWKVDHKGVPFLLPGIGGITTVMTCPAGLIVPGQDAKANIADLLGIGTVCKTGN